MTDDDKRMAAAFIRALTGSPTTACTWQTFDDGPHKRPELARILHGTLAHVGRGLEAANVAGSGVFVAVNETDGKGRKKASVRRVRASFVDCDGFEPSSFHLPPSIVVRSGRGMHAYWNTADCTLDQFTAVQKRLALHYRSDPKVHDLARVMRVPGFAHLKAEPRPVTLLYAGGETYSVDAVVSDLPGLPSPPPPMSRKPGAAGRVDWRSFDVVQVFRDAGMYRRALAGDKHAVVCPWEGEHTAPDYTSETATGTVVWRGPPQTFYCSHAHCDGRNLYAALVQLGALTIRQGKRAADDEATRTMFAASAADARRALAQGIP